MKKMLYVFLALNLSFYVAAKTHAEDIRVDGSNDSSTSQSQQASDDSSENDSGSSKKMKVEVRPGAEVEARGTLGVNAAKGSSKVAPKANAEAKFEPYIAIGGESVELKVKAGATVQGQATTDDVVTKDHRDQSDAAINLHGGLAVEAKNGLVKVEGKGGHAWTAESGQYNHLGALVGGCTSPGQQNEKYQLCGNVFLTKKFFEASKATEMGAELLIQKQTDDGLRIFGGARYAYETSDSGAPDTHYTGLTVGINSDLNASAVRASSKKQ